MNDSLIQKTIRRSNRNLLILSLVGILLVGGLGVLNARYFYNFLLGPFDVTPEELVAASSASAPQNYWLRVTGDELFNTGVQYVTTYDDGRETVEASYYAMGLGNRLLLVRLEGDQQADTLDPNLTGWISGISGEENSEILQEIEKDVPGITDVFLPYKLETGNFRMGGFVGIVVGIAILLACFWGLLTYLRRVSDPASHPVLKALAPFGPVDFVVNRLESELAVEHARIGKLNLTNNWLVLENSTNLQVTRFEDVTWIYKHITTQRYYGIPITKIYTAMVLDRFGRQLKLTAGKKEAQVNEMLKAIVARAPWAVTGYSKEIEQAWNKDRAGFLAAVDRRKSSVNAQAAQPA